MGKSSKEPSEGTSPFEKLVKAIVSIPKAELDKDKQVNKKHRRPKD